MRQAGGLPRRRLEDNDGDAAKFLKRYPIPYPSYKDGDGKVAQVFNGVGRAAEDRVLRRDGKLEYIHAGPVPRPRPTLARRHRPVRGRVAVPELRIDPLTGLRTIVAGERAGRPGGGFRAEPRPPVDPEKDPFLEGHEDRTPPELYALRPGGGAPDTPGWTVRVVPNLYPALAAARSDGATAPRVDPLAAGRGEPDLFASRPALGAHEVIVNAPAAGRLAAGARRREQVEIAMDVWRERMRAHADARVRAPDRQRGPRGGRVAAPHPRAALRAAVRARRGGARARALHRLLRPHPGPQPARGPAPGGGAPARADRRDRRRGRGDRPFASRVPFQLQIVPRRPRARFEDDGPLGAALLHDVLGRLARVLGALPPLNLWVRTAPARRRVLLLADRPAAAPHAPRRARARRRRRP